MVKAEFISFSSATREILWLQKLALKVAPNLSKMSNNFCVDNRGCTSIVQNKWLHFRSILIDVKFNLVKGMVHHGTVVLHYVSSNYMAVDIFPKLLSCDKHCAHRRLLDMEVSEFCRFKESVGGSRVLLRTELKGVSMYFS